MGIELSLLLLEGTADSIEVFERKFAVADRTQRQATFDEIRGKLKQLSAKDVHHHLDVIRRQYPEGESEKLLEEFPQFKMLTKNQLRELSSSGAVIGSHGVEHELQHSHQANSVIQDELLSSKSRLEALLGEPVHYHSYPNGDYCDASLKVARNVGYRLCFTTEQGSLRRACNRHAVPRLEPGGNLEDFVQRYHWIR